MRLRVYLAGETRFCLYLQATGNNAEATRRAGIEVDRIGMTAIAIAGALAALRIHRGSMSSVGGVGAGRCRSRASPRP